MLLIDIIESQSSSNLLIALKWPKTYNNDDGYIQIITDHIKWKGLIINVLNIIHLQMATLNIRITYLNIEIV